MTRTERDHPTHPPVKRAPWEPCIPIYFWLGGISAGSWLAATAEDVAGAGDRAVIRVGRLLAAGSLGAGTVLLIADLGRPERFLNMLRLFKPRSAMSVGAWGLAAYGAVTGLAAATQIAEDVTGRRMDRAGRALHLAGLPLALFVGAYTGTLLSSTATPAWAARAGTLAPLFLFAGASNGLAAVSLALEATGAGSDAARRRLARAEIAALTGEWILLALDRARANRLPSVSAASRRSRRALALTALAGVALPLALQVDNARKPERKRRLFSRSKERRPNRSILAAGLALAGGLALRYLVTREGYRSAATPADTWTHATEPRLIPSEATDAR